MLMALVASLSLGVCPPGVAAGLRARLDGSALPVFTPLVESALPRQIEVPSEQVVLFSCGGDEASTLTPRAGIVTPTVRSLSVSLDEGGVVIDGELDLSATADLDITLCSMPDEICPASLDAKAVRLHARIAPVVDACVPSFPFAELTVELEPALVAAHLDDCGLYSDAFTFAYSGFRDLIIATAKDALEDAMQEAIPGLLGNLTTKMVQDGFVLAGMRFGVAPQAIAVTQGGVELSFVADVQSANGRATCLPPTATMPPLSAASTSPMPFSKAMLSVTAAKPLLDRALAAAWYSGALCFDSRDYDLQLGEALAPVFPGASLEFDIVPATPPFLELSAEGDAAVSVEELRAEVDLDIGSGVSTAATAEIAATLTGTLDLDDATRSLTLTPNGATTSDMRIYVPGGSLGFTRDSLGDFIENFALPTFTEEVGSLPLTSCLLSAAPVALSMDELFVTSSGVRLDASLWPIDPNDAVPPATVLAHLPGQPSPSLVIVGLASTDDATPPAFVRHKVSVDGVLDESTYGGGQLELSLDAGVHELEIQAVDLNENVDPSPLVITVLVDDLAPVVTLEDPPAGILDEDTADIRYHATDDQARDGAITYRYEVGIVSKIRGPDVPWGGGDLGHATALTLQGLPDDSIIRVTVFARDSAGNEGSAELGFAVDYSPEMGCAAAGASPLAALVLLIARRRRSS